MENEEIMMNETTEAMTDVEEPITETETNEEESKGKADVEAEAEEVDEDASEE